MSSRVQVPKAVNEVVLNYAPGSPEKADLKAKLAEMDRAVIEIKLAEKDYWPDMDFKVAYGQRQDSQTGQDRPDFLSGSVVFKVPLWQKNRQDKKLAASKKKHEAALKAYQNLAETLPHRIDALATEIVNIQKTYRLYADALMVQAEQWAHSSLTAYEVGKVEFNTMIKAQVRLLRLELQAERYLFQIYQKITCRTQSAKNGPPVFLKNSG